MRDGGTSGWYVWISRLAEPSNSVEAGAKAKMLWKQTSPACFLYRYPETYPIAGFVGHVLWFQNSRNRARQKGFLVSAEGLEPSTP